MVRVVVAEDDRSVAMTVSRVMESVGYFPVICSDGQRALHVIEDNPSVRLLITDVSMPNMDGRELILKLREDERFAKLPTIILSGVVSASEIADLLEAEENHFFEKPVNPEGLKKYARSFVE